MKIVFLADNRVRPNYGCRGTSMALCDMISESNEVIYTIYGYITGYYDFNYIRKDGAISFSDRVRMAPNTQKHPKKVIT